jgi:hypothetical protein
MIPAKTIVYSIEKALPVSISGSISDCGAPRRGIKNITPTPMKTPIATSLQRIVLITGTFAFLITDGQAATLPQIKTPADSAKITSIPVNVEVSLGGLGKEDVQSVVIRSGETALGHASPASLFGEWVFPDGSHVSVMEGSTAEPVMIDYSPPHPSMMYLMGGDFSNANTFNGTFTHWDGNNPDPITGNAKVVFSFSNMGLLNAAISGAAPLNSRSVNGGRSYQEGYRFVWKKPPAGGHTLTAVVTYLDSMGGGLQTFTTAPVRITVKVPNAPEIVVQQPLGSNLEDGKAKKSCGTVAVGKSGKAKTFTIKNIGTAKLTGLAITKTGKNSKDFLIAGPAKSSLAAGESTTFKVIFKPTAKGTRNAAIRIKSNDADENPFDIKLTGSGAAR